MVKNNCGLEQWSARESHKLKVTGSNPVPASKSVSEIKSGTQTKLIPEPMPLQRLLNRTRLKVFQYIKERDKSKADFKM